MEKKLSDLNSYEGHEKELKALDAHREALSSIITKNPYFGELLERIKNSYELFIEKLIINQRKEIEAVKKEMKEMMDEEIRKLKEELNDEQKKSKIPKIDLSAVRSDEEVKIKEVEQNKKKAVIPSLKIKNIGPIQGYQDEFMAKESEFSPSWREKLAKEKRF